MSSMKQTTKKARVIYNEEFDSFDVEIKTEDGWGLDQRYKCQVSSQSRTGEANCIHFGILNKINELQWLGYDVRILQ